MDAIISVGEDQRILMFNRAAEAMFRTSAETVIGQPLETLIPTRFHKSHRGHIEGFARAGVTNRTMGQLGLIYGLRSDGEEFPIEASISQVTVDGHKVFTVILRDITDRVRAELDLKHSQRRLAGIVDSAMDAVISVNSQQRIVLFNHAAEQMFRCGVSEALGQSLDRFLPERFRKAHKGHIEDFGSTGVTTRSMGQLGLIYGLRSNGEEFPIEASISQVIVEGEPLYTVILRDVSERVKARREIEKLVSLIESCAELVAFATPTGSLSFVNRAGVEMTGLSNPESWPDHALRDLVPNQERPRFDELIAQITQTGNHWIGEMTLTGADAKSEVPVMMNLFLVANPAGGEVAALACVALDIREKKAAEQQVRQTLAQLEQRVQERTAELSRANSSLRDEVLERARAEDQLRRTNAELEAFAHSISHDLKAPLRAVLGFSSALAEDYGPQLDDKAGRYLKIIADNASHMAAMLDDLLSLAKLGRENLIPQPCDLQKVAARAIENLAITIKESGADVRVAKDLPTIQGLPVALEQVFQNLLDNGIKFVPAERKPLVELTCQSEPDAVHIQFKDNGIGIDARYINKLFQLFERLHNRNEYPGTGVGLAIVKKAVDLHGGEVWIESELGKGSTFHVRLPVKMRAQHAPDDTKTAHRL